MGNAQSHRQLIWHFTLTTVFAVVLGSAALAQPRVSLPPGTTYPPAGTNVWGGNPAPAGMFPPGATNPAVTGGSAIYGPATVTPIPAGAPTGTLPYGSVGSAPPAGVFDPYAPTFRPSTAPASYPPVMPNSTPSWGLGNLFQWNTQPPPNLYNQPTLPNGFGQPINIPPGSIPPGTFNPNAYPPGTYPSTIYPNAQPNVLFPGTGPTAPNSWNSPMWGSPNSTFGQSWNNWWSTTTNNLGYQSNQVIRLYQGVRFRHTFLPGNSDFRGLPSNGLESNDSEVSLVFAIPGFLSGSQPLYLIPSYTQHLWEGPKKPGTDLPGSAFSAFLDTAWETNPMQTLGAELGARVGVFSAFDAISSNSIRIQGKALARLRLTPTSTFRAGVYYIDRNHIKLLPAVGFLWVPNPDTRFDIFFPEPKLSHYVSTLGNTDIWWYLSGYYGGGAWTIKQTDGTTDEIDINDIRVMLGIEYGRSDLIRQGYRAAFIEAGFAFNRELLYRNRDTSNLNLENSLVFRAGFGY